MEKGCGGQVREHRKDRRHGAICYPLSLGWLEAPGSCPWKEQGTCQSAGLAPILELPLLPVLAVGTRAGHAASFLPRLGLSGQGLLHLQLDLGGTQPTDGQVVSRNILHCQLLLPCGKEKRGSLKPRVNPLPFCT
jgi:hypothetical protein